MSDSLFGDFAAWDFGLRGNGFVVGGGDGAGGKGYDVHEVVNWFAGGDLAAEDVGAAWRIAD